MVRAVWKGSKGRARTFSVKELVERERQRVRDGEIEEET